MEEAIEKKTWNKPITDQGFLWWPIKRHYYLNGSKAKGDVIDQINHCWQSHMQETIPYTSCPVKIPVIVEFWPLANRAKANKGW